MTSRNVILEAKQFDNEAHCTDDINFARARRKSSKSEIVCKISLQVLRRNSSLYKTRMGLKLAYILSLSFGLLQSVTNTRSSDIEESNNKIKTKGFDGTFVHNLL